MKIKTAKKNSRYMVLGAYEGAYILILSKNKVNCVHVT